MNWLKNFARTRWELVLIILVCGVFVFLISRYENAYFPPQTTPPACRAFCREHHFGRWSWKPLTRDEHFPRGECTCIGED